MSFMLSLSILAPALIDVLSMDVAIEIVENTGDEESKKESKKEMEEKVVYYESVASALLVNLNTQRQHNHHYLSMPYLAGSDILVPPPRA